MKKIFFGLGVLVSVFVMSLTLSNAQTSGCINLQSNLSFGMQDTYQGGEVAKLQQFLVSKGYLSNVTGYFYYGTQGAVANYQRSKGISPTGYVGEQTRAAISAETCGTTYPNPNPVPPTPSPMIYYYYCSLNGQIYNTITDYNTGCQNQNVNTGKFYCSLNNQLYSDWYSYSNSCKFSSPVNPSTAPYNCKIWYDGCNTCSRSSVGGQMMCTMMACYTSGTPYCREYFSGSPSPTPNITSFSGPSNLNLNQSGTWTVSANISDNSQLTYYVSWGDENYYPYPATSYQTYTQNTTFTHTYSQAGTYNVTITVKSSNGQTSQTSATVVVNNQTNNICALETTYQGGGFVPTNDCTCPAGSNKINMGQSGELYFWKCSTQTQSNTCPINGQMFGDTQYPNCNCPAGYQKVIYNSYPAQYQCVSTNPVGSYCPTYGDFYDYYYPNCTCPSGYNKVSSYSGVSQCVNNPMTIMKPVIYLYPTKTQKVSVKLDYDGELFVTYPEYNEGWLVKASPNGTLINLADKKEYSYLFWEGNPASKIDYDMTKGFLVKGSDTVKFLQEKLKEIGLTPKEYNEFIVFWYPKMKDNKYNIIHFASKSEYDDHAKLTVSPKPSSVLRVFMVYKATEDPNTNVIGQEFSKFKRKGFTLVEWGGTELK